MIALFDSHCHLAAPEWQQSPQQLYADATAAGIEQLLMPGVRSCDWPHLLRLAHELPGVLLAPGLHPLYSDQWNAAVADQLRVLTREPKVVAIGEIGLDGVAGPPLEQQQEVFRAQLQIALEAKLPVLIHSRKTTGAVLAILKELQIGTRVGGIWHGFSGSREVATELVQLGFALGIGPTLLRRSARKLPHALAGLPDSALVLETDAPDMIDNPTGLHSVAQKLAELRGWSLSDCARITRQNSLRILRQERTANRRTEQGD